jgi:hypothetical protein
LRAACATAPVNQPGNLRTVSHKAIEDAKQEHPADELTILVTVVDADADAGPVLETMRATTSIVIGVSAGAATAEQLGRVAAVGAGRAVAGVLIANPVTTGRGTGPFPYRVEASERWQPNWMSDITAARDAMLAAEARMRVLIAYGREFTRPRPYRLEDLARAVGMSISGVRTAYADEVAARLAGIRGSQPSPIQAARGEVLVSRCSRTW